MNAVNQTAKVDAKLELLRQPGEFRNQFVTALLECNSIEDPANRQHVISKLPKYIKHNIPAPNAGATVQVDEIVGRCLDHNNGIQSLIQAIEAIEGNSLPLQNVKKLLTLDDSIHEDTPLVTSDPVHPGTKKSAVPETNPEPVNPPPGPEPLPPDLPPDTRPVFSIHVTKQGSDHLNVQFGAGSTYKNHPNVPLVNIEHLFYNRNNHSPHPAENLFGQGCCLYKGIFGNDGDGWEQVSPREDGRLAICVDAETSKLPWEALAHPTSGFVERYLSQPIVRKLRETDGKDQVLRLEKPRVGLICAGDDPGYYDAIVKVVPMHLRNVEVVDVNLDWGALFNELQGKQPSILHVVANGIGKTGFVAEDDVFESGLDGFIEFLTKLPTVKLLILCTQYGGKLFLAHYRILERLYQHTMLSSVVIIPSAPEDHSALICTEALYKAFLLGHDIEAALTVGRAKLHIADFKEGNQRSLPMLYEKENVTINPMSNWLQQLQDHLKFSPLAREYVDELSQTGYEIQLCLYHISEVQSKALQSQFELLSSAEQLTQMLQRFSRFVGMMDQRYSDASQEWKERLIQEFSYARFDIERVVVQANKGKVTQHSLKNGISTWEKVVKILNQCPE